MQQPELINVNKSLQRMTNSVSRQSSSSQIARLKGELVRERFGDRPQFLAKVNPDTQVHFGRNTEAAVMGDYPTINDIDNAYGKDFAVDWLMPQIASIATHTGAKNLTLDQEYELARIIATEYRYFKITELLLFFYRFKAGHYGRFYGSVDPMVITCALRDFLRERGELISLYEQEKRKRDEEEEMKRNPPMTRAQYINALDIEIRTIIAEYNSEYTV